MLPNFKVMEYIHVKTYYVFKNILCFYMYVFHDFKIREWSLITVGVGVGVGLQNGKGGGASEVSPLQKAGGRAIFSNAEGGGGGEQQVLR